MDHLPIRRALVSVTDKSGLVPLCQALAREGAEIVSTGGTRKKILDAGCPVTSVSDVTGFPEILGGRVKTLHPLIHAGILADKDSPEHMDTLQEQAVQPFDLICVNLYNFEEASRRTSNARQLVEEIDIGGPTLLRAGAKNYHSILVLPDPSCYEPFLEDWRSNAYQVGLDFRLKMAIRTFTMVSHYDAMIAEAFQSLDQAEGGWQ